MRLLSLYIENFGALSSFRYEFEPGVNSITLPNGGGKSTLAAFLRAMLYGLPASRAQDLTENERKRRMPWQGGVAGGSLCFSVGERSYRVERTFGARESEDTFSLFSLDTALPSSDYSERLGLELLGLDEAGYDRTLSLSGHCKSGEGYATVQSKLAEQEDVALFDRAMARLDARRKHYKLAGGRGRVAELERELGTLERRQEDLREGEPLGALAARASEARRACAEARAAREEHLTSVGNAQAASAAALTEAERERDSLREGLGAVPPTPDMLREMKGMAEMIEQDRQKPPCKAPRFLGVPLSYILLALVLSGTAIALALLLPCYPLMAAAVLPPLALALLAYRARCRRRARYAPLRDALARYSPAATAGDSPLERVRTLAAFASRLHHVGMRVEELRRACAEGAGAAFSARLAALDAALGDAEARAHDADCAHEAGARRCEELDTVTHRLGQVRKEHARAKQALDAILLAEELLELAKGRLLARYRSAVEDGFRRYSELFFGVMQDALPSVSPEFEITLTLRGRTHPLEALSTGEQALLRLALRLALNDALFPHEAPTLVMDDPFEALDDSHMEQALAALTRLAETRQILYLTCTEARAL